MTESHRGTHPTRRIRPTIVATIAFSLASMSLLACTDRQSASGARAETTAAGVMSDSAPDAPSASNPYGLRGALASPPASKAPFTLTDTEGKPFDFRARTNGNLTFLYFGYTHCPDVCPLHMANLAAAMKELPASDRARIRVVFVTTDPERDTPKTLRQWLDNFDTAFVGVRGTMAEINRVESTLGLGISSREEATAEMKQADSASYGVMHPAALITYTPDDSLRVLYPFGARKEDLGHDLPILLRIGKR